MVNWLEGPGSEQLRAQWGIGDSIRASQALQQKHEEIESQHSVSSFLHSSLRNSRLLPKWLMGNIRSLFYHKNKIHILFNI